MPPPNESTAGPAGASRSDKGLEKFLSAIAESVKKFPFDPLCERPHSLISMMSTTSTVSSHPDGDGGAATVGRDGGIMPSSPLSVIWLRPNVTVPEVRMPSFTSFAVQMEQLVSEYIMAISVGAALGAAVAAGIGVGCVAASGLVSGVRVLPSFWYRLSRTRRWIIGFWAGAFPPNTITTTRDEHGAITAVADENESNDGRDDTRTAMDTSQSTAFESSSRGRGQSSGEVMDIMRSTEDVKTSFLGFGENRIFVIRGDVRPHGISPSGSTEQCRECLDDLSVQLSKNLLGWQHVRRLTAYLVGGDAVTFRIVLKEYPLSRDTTVISVMFVQRLEREYAGVQVEALASF